MTKRKLGFFTSNRADFGFILPIIKELKEEFHIELFISGAHLLKPWNTFDFVDKSIDELNTDVKLSRIEIDDLENSYLQSSSRIQTESFNLMKNNCLDAVFVVGDRVEILGFVTAAYLLNIPIIHYAGGDIVNVPFFDTNIRHCISKLAHLHLTTNDHSSKILEQLGEEKWRIKTVGNLTYSLDKSSILPNKKYFRDLYSLNSKKKVIIFTLHSYHHLSAENNLNLFLEILDHLNNIDENVIVTYPNNDTGSSLIIKFLESEDIKRFANIKFITNLGTNNLLSLYKFYDAIAVGNSSSGLIETCFYGVPAINIGNRQTDRPRGQNVYDVSLDIDEILKKLKFIIKNYSKLKKENLKNNDFFGGLDVVEKACCFIKENLLKDKALLLYKKFIRVKNE